MCAVMAGTAAAQENHPAKVEIAWDRYYTYAQIGDQLKAIAAAYPDLVTVKSIGKTRQGRDIWLAIVNNSNTGSDTSKPAMWIDGNVHGNEIQAAEAVVYSLWYLTKAYGKNEKLTRLLDSYSFYLLPSQNPDGREYWFNAPNDSSSSRSNQRPVDSDQDGLFDEDPPDDLDKDGSITTMWKHDPDNGRYVRSQTDPRVFIRVKPDQKGDWTNLGDEGIDNDGDGRINEDPLGGDDMNRNWPSDWQPSYVQFGAGQYPFSNPETKAIGDFILAHPNIAAVQSYHNAGGMILRGPGTQYRESQYPGEDRRVYDEIQRIGEQLLPYYRAMVIYRDLYIVHGGFVNWTAEGLGIISFTNELWNDSKYFQRDGGDGDEREWLWRDRMAFGQVFTDYKEFDHPFYGKVLIGGPNKWSSRVTPTFMLEEECHRNFAFTMYHADQMPLLEFGRTDVVPVEGLPGLWVVTTEVRNAKLIPTRTGQARNNRIGTNDLLVCELKGAGRLVASGTVGGWFDRQMRENRFEPARIQVDAGIPGWGARIFRFVIEGTEGEEIVLRYSGEKVKTVEKLVVLKATEKRE
jgi:hypothetical protein